MSQPALNPMSLLGYAWLIRELALAARPLAVESRLGTRMRTTQKAGGATRHEYPPQYAPASDAVGHLEFALKHEYVDLCLLRDVFLNCGAAPIEAAIRARPTGRYTRLLGFFYEFTTGQTLDPGLEIGGNYTDALVADECFVSPTPRRNKRWRVWDNLLGDSRYCPMVRRTPAIVEGLAMPLQDELRGLVADFPPELFRRASDYLYLKETRSTYGIENEAMPPADRTRRFVALLRSAGEGNLAGLLSEAELVKRQSLIVDPRYAVPTFRENHNYVGEQRPDYSQRLHYICPPPQWMGSLVAGLAHSAQRSGGLPALVQAATVAFGFVFIHPFEDGNGRLHRFLIHDLLHRGGFVADNVMLPVSATMLRHMPDYDATLEHYSRPLLDGWLAYEMDEEGALTITNPEQVEGYYRYPDLTAQTEYLIRTVALSIREDFAEELRFLRGYDAARAAIREIVDLPDRRLDLLLRLLHQTGGRLAKAKRQQFAEIADEELERIRTAFTAAFGPSA
ncbi:MAG: Fic family protein [Sulfuritalea sp.]|nr:Fic family protein [Sulfuritalea sp.]